MRFPVANDSHDSTMVKLAHGMIMESTKDLGDSSHPIEINFELALRDLIIVTRYILGDQAFVKLLQEAVEGMIDD